MPFSTTIKDVDVWGNYKSPFMNDLRRNVLLRSLAFAGFAAATLACLFWSFEF